MTALDAPLDFTAAELEEWDHLTDALAELEILERIDPGRLARFVRLTVRMEDLGKEIAAAGHPLDHPAQTELRHVITGILELADSVGCTPMSPLRIQQRQDQLEREIQAHLQQQDW